jgi:hypothetical protein
VFVFMVLCVVLCVVLCGLGGLGGDWVGRWRMCSCVCDGG